MSDLLTVESTGLVLNQRPMMEPSKLNMIVLNDQISNNYIQPQTSSFNEKKEILFVGDRKQFSTKPSFSSNTWQDAYKDGVKVQKRNTDISFSNQNSSISFRQGANNGMDDGNNKLAMSQDNRILYDNRRGFAQRQIIHQDESIERQNMPPLEVNMTSQTMRPPVSKNQKRGFTIKKGSKRQTLGQPNRQTPLKQEQVRNQSQQMFKPKTNDMRNSPFLQPVISSIGKNPQRLDLIQKQYPKFMDQLYKHQVQWQRQKSESNDAMSALIIQNKRGQSGKIPLPQERYDHVNPVSSTQGLSFGIQGLKVHNQSIQSDYILGRNHRSGVSSELEPLMQAKQKRFWMNVGYPDLRMALLKRGWKETLDKYDETVDLRFAFSHTDIDYHKLKKGCFINHCRAEGSMTCKTALIETLTESQNFWTSWLTPESTEISTITIPGYEKYGIDSFFPKSFVISNIHDQAMFFEETVFDTCEAYLKLFIQAFEKDEKFLNKNQSFVKEKLVVCTSLIMRKLLAKKVDQILDQSKKEGERCYQGNHLTQSEHAFILRGAYPESYIKFIHREEWFEKMNKTMQKYFFKDKSLKAKEDRKYSYWTNVYQHVKIVIQEMKEGFIQTDMNGNQNLWIVKPGGLSRGRNIRLFDNYALICQYAGIPYLQNPNGQQVFDLHSQVKSEQPSWTQKSWVAQKYIENPLLIMNRKFDIRVWVFVSSWNPLKVYYFKDCYIRFSSMDYDPSKKDNLFSHLTNNAITSKQIRMPDDKKFDKIPGNMWYLHQLKKQLNERQIKIANSPSKKIRKIPSTQPSSSEEAGPNSKEDQQSSPEQPEQKSEKKQQFIPEGDVWDTQIENQLKDIIKLTFLSGWGYVEWREGSVGIYGLDVMIDTNLRCWLIEVNKCPCMAYSTDITRTLVPQFMEDITKIMVDKKIDPKCDIGGLELLLECPVVREPTEHRKAEEFTVQGTKIRNPNEISKKK